MHSQFGENDQTIEDSHAKSGETLSSGSEIVTKIVVEAGPLHADATRAFQGVPSIAVTARKRVWATWYGGGTWEGPENYVMLATSGDGGKTWGEPALVVDLPIRVSEPAVWLDPKGRLWWMWNQYPSGLTEPTGELWAITTEDPDLKNPVWSAPRRIAKELHNFNKPTVLEDGTWLWPTGSWNPQNPSRPLLSRDGGDTFFPGGEIPVPAEVREFDEYQVLQKHDGSLWLLTRTKDGIAESTSFDGGRSWTGLTASKIVHPVSRFFITRLSSGRLLLIKHGKSIDSYEDWSDLTVKARCPWPVHHKGRNHLTAWLSDDEGENWQGGLMIDDRDLVSYPDGVQTEDGLIYVIYDHQRQEEKEILMAIFQEDDLLAGTPVSDQARFRMRVNKGGGVNPQVQTQASANSTNL